MNIDLADFLASFPYAASTRRTYADILSRIFTGSQEPEKMTASELLELLNQSGWGNARQCVALAATQKFLAWKYGQSHPALTAKLKRLRGKPQRALTPKVALKLLASFDTYTAKGARDLGICALALDTGLRASELCRLLLADTDLDHRVLQVIVKGGKWAAAVFSTHTAEHIQRWLHYRKPAKGQGFLFTNTFTGEGLTPEGLNQIVRQWGIAIDIKLSPHDLRRSFATIATELMGAPERILMEGGRWSNSEMIQRYTRTLKLESMRKYLPVAGLLGETPEEGIIKP
jgi:integrase